MKRLLKSDISGLPKMTDPLLRTLMSPNERDSNGESANVVDGLFAIARSLGEVAIALHRLGNNDAYTSMGAIEAASLKISESLDRVAYSLPGRESDD